MIRDLKAIAAVAVAILAVLAGVVLFPHVTLLLAVLVVLIGVPVALIRWYRRRRSSGE